MAPKCTTSILKKLRDVMKSTNYVSQTLHAYVVPSCDAHQSEYIAANHQRRAFISGFTGSLGTAIVTEQHAALWTDGRYFLQAEQELDSNWILMKEDVTGTPTYGQWLNKVLPVGGQVGVDPFLVSYDAWRTLADELKLEGNSLVAVGKNLVDVIWENESSIQSQTIKSHSVEYAGKTWQEKVSCLHKEMTEEKVSVLILTFLDEIAWLFNLRGSDIPYNPVFFSYAAITLDTVYLFLDSDALSPDARKSLMTNSDLTLKLLPYENMISTLESLINGKMEGKVWISGNSSYALVSRIPETQRLLKASPVAVHKCIKNEQEITGARNGHVKDAVAVCEFLCWLSKNISSGNITEVDAVEKLEDFRKKQSGYDGDSFDTISCSGPNAAIIHYRPKKNTEPTYLSAEDIYLCDSGAQYRDGATTDITRTVHFGTPSAFQKKCYTLVLKGHIAVSSLIFPKFTKGFLLDSFARHALWDFGLNYAHGTGHGVGSYLNVHEGPMGIGFRPHPNDPGLQPGMILSIEPGCYVQGKFGIRLENLALVKDIETEHSFESAGFITFEPLTLVPFQVKLIEPTLLTEKEVQWINEYHAKCREVVGKVLEEQGKVDALTWLIKETLPLG